MSKVIFYRLGQKFLERESDLPASSPEHQVIYQTLALGHHLGVIDCLQPVLQCDLAGYARWVDALPEGEGRRKLAGLLKFGEIMIDASHCGTIAAALDAANNLAEPARSWSATLMQLLRAIAAEPAMYLMVKRRD